MAEPIASGPAFQISTQNANLQDNGSAAVLADGRIVVVWRDVGTNQGDIKFRIMNADGTPSGVEGTVNATTTGQQTTPTVTGTIDGGFVVAWTTYATDAGGDIAYRSFNPDGSPAMATDGVATANTAGIQVDADITAFDNGTFAIGWNEGNTAVSGLSSSYAAMVRLFDNAGPTAAAFRISGNWGGEYGPSLDSDGLNLLAAWDDSGGPSSTQNGEDGIYTRVLLDPLPTTHFTDGGTRADTGTFREASMDPDVAMTGHGPIVVWDDVTTGSTGRDIYVALNGAQVRVNTTTAGDQADAAVAALADGGYVVVWTDLGAAGGSDIRARVFSAPGVATSDDFLVTEAGAPSAGAQYHAAVVGLIDGRFLVTWSDGANGAGVNGRIFDARSAPIDWMGGALSELVVGTDFAAGDTLIGNEGDDTLLGMGGNDIIWGVDGTNRLDGGRGRDTLDYHAVGVNIDITLNGSTLTRVRIGTDTVDRFRNFENVIGGASDDRIIGDSAANRLEGRGGGDLLDGKAGLDTLTGGDGGDSFVFSAAPLAKNRDRITDFTSGQDQIHLSASVFSALGATLDAAEFVTGPAVDPDDHLIWDAGQHTLFWDADGSGAGNAVAIAVLQPGAILTFFDLVLV